MLEREYMADQSEQRCFMIFGSPILIGADEFGLMGLMIVDHGEADRTMPISYCFFTSTVERFVLFSSISSDRLS